LAATHYAEPVSIARMQVEQAEENAARAGF
jgi:hypothetical protein